MKEIKAYFKEHKQGDVINALRRIEGLTGLSISESHGYGIGWKTEDGSNQIDFQHGIKLTIVCLEALVEPVIKVIEEAAYTGLKGDGKIYVAEIIEAIRISSGERGEAAV